MRTQILSFSLLVGLSVASFSTFAEPVVQAGETLESLSKAKVTTTVNGQPGSLNELLSSGQIKLVEGQTTDVAQPAATQVTKNQVPNASGVAEAQSVEPAVVEADPNTEAPQPAEPAN